MFAAPDAVSTWLKSTAAEFEARIDELDGLDAAIGDGDHGTNMAPRRPRPRLPLPLGPPPAST